MNTIMLLSFAIYFIILSAIGFVFYKRTQTAQDFIIGDRSVNYFVTAIATQASDMGAWLFLGLPAAVFLNGFSEIWAAIGLIFFMFLSWQYIAPKLRRESEQYNSSTYISYFGSKYKDNTGIIRLIGSCILLFFFTMYISAGLVGLGRLFEAAFDITYFSGVILAITTALVYTLIGGFLAVAWCDLFQGLFLLAMIVMVPLVAYFHLGGWNTLSSLAHTVNINYASFFSLSSIGLALGWGLGYFGQPHILTNFMGIDDPKKIRYAKYVGITWQIIVLSSSVLIGIIGAYYFAGSNIASELIFVQMAKDLFPPLIAGFAVCGIFAATLSSMDSLILISGSTFAEDLYKTMYNKNASSKQILWMSRAASIVVSLSAVYLARNNSESIYDLVNYAWAGLGSAFGPLILTTFYWGKTTKQGALAGMVVGALVSGLWHYTNTSVLPLIPGFAASLAAILIVSLMTQEKKAVQPKTS